MDDDNKALGIAVITLILLMVVLVVGSYSMDRAKRKKIEELQQRIRVLEQEKYREKIESP